MAIVTNNIITQGLSGRVGNLVFKTRGNKTYVCALPAKNENRVITEAQKEVQLKFIAATASAKRAIKNPVLYEKYKKAAKPGQSPYDVAFAYAFK